MESNDLRKRGPQTIPEPHSDFDGGPAGNTSEPHPAGDVKHGVGVQLALMLLFSTWFNACVFSIFFTQFLGAPLYFFNKDYYYAWMALTKQSFGIVIITITQWFSPTLVRVSGDASVRGQLRKTADGRLETMFPDRMVLISNHQIYTDWLYLWWVGYTSRMHGHIFIVLKESIKYVPIIGSGMMFFGFIFMARKWASDKLRLQHRLVKLKSQHYGPMSGSAGLDPMWLMLFPEGTNLSANTRKGSKAWAEKQNIPDLQHLLLPRSTGLLFCLQQLQGTIDWVYDCTIAYEGVPKTRYAAEFFTLRSTYFQGRPPKSVNMYWRRFAVSQIPLHDPHEFEAWLLARWKEKDRLLEQFQETGFFPGEESVVVNKSKDKSGYIECDVRLAKWYEIGQIFVTLAALALVVDVITKSLAMAFPASRQ